VHDKLDEIKNDYDTGGSSTTSDTPQTLEPVVDAVVHEIEVQKYGTGKPKRLVIRAKITHGRQD
jgi:hypothetical protein